MVEVCAVVELGLVEIVIGRFGGFRVAKQPKSADRADNGTGVDAAAAPANPTTPTAVPRLSDQ